MVVRYEILKMECRPQCAACCIVPSISRGMPAGKAAGLACIQLDEALRCKIFGQQRRPMVCVSLSPEPEMCGDDREHAIGFLTQMERQTSTF